MIKGNEDPLATCSVCHQAPDVWRCRKHFIVEIDQLESRLAEARAMIVCLINANSRYTATGTLACEAATALLARWEAKEGK